MVELTLDDLHVGARNYILNSAEYWFDGSDYPATSNRLKNSVIVTENESGNCYHAWMPLSPDFLFKGKQLTCSIDVEFHGDYYGETFF